MSDRVRRLKYGRKTCYVCQKCGGKISTYDLDDGITPRILGCLVLNQEIHCEGVSKAVHGKFPMDAPEPQWEWFQKDKSESSMGLRTISSNSLKRIAHGKNRLVTRGMSDLERFMYWVEKDLITRCWNWKSPAGTDGYGQFQKDGKLRVAHAAGYEILVGKVPEDKELDHLCRNRIFVNPDHLEPVTHVENILRSPVSIAAINSRKTQCNYGHPLPAYVHGRQRICKVCKNDRKNERILNSLAAKEVV